MRLKLKNVKPSEITPYFNNPRKNDLAVEKVAESIKSFDFQQPILVDENMEIIAGHTRWKAALKLDLKEIPVVVSSGLTEKKKKAYRIADNKVSEAAEWDFEKLKLEIDDLDGLYTGWEEGELDRLFISPDDFGESFTLPGGDRAPFQQMTFTLADSQAEMIKGALANVRQNDEYKYMETYGNENTNGNALALVIEQWAEQKTLSLG